MTAVTRAGTLSRVMTSWGGTSKVTVLNSTLTILSTIGIRMKRPGPLARPCTLPSLKMTPRSYSLTILMALVRINKMTATTATNTMAAKPIPTDCNKPKLMFMKDTPFTSIFSDRHSSSAGLSRWRPEQSSLADILDGEHAHQLSVLGNGQRPETTLLQDGKTLLEKISLRRDRGDIRLHQLTHARVPLRGVGRGHDLLTRDHAYQIPSLVHHGEVLLVAVDDHVQYLSKGVVGRNGLGVGSGSHDIGDAQAARELPLPHHLGLSGSPKEDEHRD